MARRFAAVVKAYLPPRSPGINSIAAHIKLRGILAPHEQHACRHEWALPCNRLDCGFFDVPP